MISKVYFDCILTTGNPNGMLKMLLAWKIEIIEFPAFEHFIF